MILKIIIFLGWVKQTEKTKRGEQKPPIPKPHFLCVLLTGGVCPFASGSSSSSGRGRGSAAQRLARHHLPPAYASARYTVSIYALAVGGAAAEHTCPATCLHHRARAGRDAVCQCLQWRVITLRLSSGMLLQPARWWVY